MKIIQHDIFKFGLLIPIFMMLFLFSSNSAIAQTVVLTTSDTQWTVPAGVTSVTVECWGAGGGGGSGSRSGISSGGGGGGSYSSSVIAVTAGNSYPVTVGSGGSIGAKANGGAGGDTWFINTSTVLAKGGSGGIAAVGNTPGSGSSGGQTSAGIGTIKFSGGTGGNGTNAGGGANGGGGGSSAGNAADGGNGGTPTAGIAPTGGGGGGVGGSNSNGTAGNIPGGGGGGEGGRNSGALGANGQIIITYSLGPNCATSTNIAPLSAQDLCQGTGANLLTATVTNSGGSGTPTTQYQWYYNTANSNTIIGATKISGATFQTYTPLSTASEVGTRYYFCVGYATDNGCVQTDTTQSLASTDIIQVTVTVPPTTANSGSPQTLCTDTTTLAGNNPAIGTGLWTVVSGSSNFTTATLYNTAVTALGFGDNVLRWTISNGACTPTTSDVTITNNKPTTPTAGSDQFLCGTSTTLAGNTVTDGTGVWSKISGTATFTDTTNPLMAVTNLGNGDTVFRWTATSGSCVLFEDVIINSQATAPATPSAIVGTLQVSPSNLYVYTIASVPLATNYVWTYPTGSGWGYSSGQGTTSLTIIGGNDSTSGFITVYAENTCGASGTTSTAEILSVYLPPHENCNQCHITHNSLGSALTNYAGNANLCLNCHNAVGTASAKPFVNADKAVPGTLSGTSHSWNVPAVNPTFDAELPTDSEMALRIVDFDNDLTDDIICSTCHNQHNQSQGSPYLRVDNTGDNLCKDCHKKRDVGSYLTDQANKGSHPVGVVYPTDSRFEATPLDSKIKTPGGNVECSSCHSVHDVTGAIGTTTDGYILRVANDVNLCKNCHNYQPHNGMDCLDCHTVHNTDKTNIMMIRDNITNPTLSQSLPVVFTSRGDNASPPGSALKSFADGDGTYDGVCEVCHSNSLSPDPNHNYNQPPDPSNSDHYSGEKCTGCHLHGNDLGSFKAPEPGGGGECGTCHPVNGVSGQMTSGSHAIHISRGDGLYAYMNNENDNTMCNICHDKYGDTTDYASLPSNHDDGFVDVDFDPNGMAESLGRTSGASYSNNGAAYPSAGGGTCTVYCHSTGTSASRGSMATGGGADQWGSGPSADSYASPVWGSSTSSQNCNICHPGNGDPTEGAWTAPYKIFRSAPPSAGNPASAGHGANAHLTNSEWFTDNATQPWNGTSITDGWGTARGTSTQCFWCHNADPALVTDDVNGKLQGTYGTQYHLDGQTWFNPFNYDPNSPTTDPLNPPVDGSGFALLGQGTMAPGLNRSSGAHCSSSQSCW